MKNKNKKLRKILQARMQFLLNLQGPLEKPAHQFSFDELTNLKCKFVWYEDLVNHKILPCLISNKTDKESFSIFIDGVYSIFKKNYGKKYICWTANPNKE